MDATQILVALLVIGAPLALFLSLRGGGKATGDGAKASAAKPNSGTGRAKPPADYGIGREDSPAPAASAAGSEPDTANAARAAAAAAAGGALIIAAGYSAHHHSGEAGGESPHVGHSGGGPDSGDSGGSGDGDGGGGGE